MPIDSHSSGKQFVCRQNTAEITQTTSSSLRRDRMALLVSGNRLQFGRLVLHHPQMCRANSITKKPGEVCIKSDLWLDAAIARSLSKELRVVVAIPGSLIPGSQLFLPILNTWIGGVPILGFWDYKQLLHSTFLTVIDDTIQLQRKYFKSFCCVSYILTATVTSP